MGGDLRSTKKKNLLNMQKFSFLKVNQLMGGWFWNAATAAAACSFYYYSIFFKMWVDKRWYKIKSRLGANKKKELFFWDNQNYF